ncbi:hypothetical protein NPIL_468781 [Nephila pilipes]|uniref:Uncharacterized protein n=1 Tax=Nephila pilipes TaxID=299642 RepID=A0A8X6MZI0_NEPPI|nr:hypothetical protein NPIL_468781 [Nephila pilipes]
MSGSLHDLHVTAYHSLAYFFWDISIIGYDTPRDSTVPASLLEYACIAVALLLKVSEIEDGYMISRLPCAGPVDGHELYRGHIEHFSLTCMVSCAGRVIHRKAYSDRGFPFMCFLHITSAHIISIPHYIVQSSVYSALNLLPCFIGCSVLDMCLSYFLN